MLVKTAKFLLFTPFWVAALVFGGIVLMFSLSPIATGAFAMLAFVSWSVGCATIGGVVVSYLQSEKIELIKTSVAEYKAGAEQATSIMSHIVAKTARPTRQTQIEAETGQQSPGFPMQPGDLVIEGLKHDLAEEE